MASHVVGFTNIDDQGQEGIELSMEDHLSGHSGRKKVVRDLLGRVIQDIEVLEPAEPGEDVTLSIDLRLQYLAYRELLGAVQKFKAKGGSAVVLGCAHRLKCSPWSISRPTTPTIAANLDTGALRNRAVTDLFEPGSTMKPFTVAAALEMGMVTPSTTINTHPGTLRVGSKNHS